MRYIKDRELCSKLDDLCEFLANSYRINAGGCCFVAMILAKYFDKLNIPYELFIESRREKDLQKIREEIRNNKRNYSFNTSVVGAFTCEHYFLKVLNYGFINCAGADIDECYRIKSVTHQDIKWIYNNGKWNNDYSVKNNNIIINFIELLFKDYEKELER